MCIWTMRSYNIRNKELIFSVKLTPQAFANLIRTKSQQSPRCLPPQTRSKYNHLLDWSTTCPNFLLDCQRLQSHQRVSKGQGTFQLGPRISICLYTDENWDCKCSHVGLLHSKEANCLANWCKHKRFRYMSASRKTSLLSQQSANRCIVGICSFWIRIACSCLGNGEIPSLPVCKSFYLGNQSEALRSNFI